RVPRPGRRRGDPAPRISPRSPAAGDRSVFSQARASHREESVEKPLGKRSVGGEGGSGALHSGKKGGGSRGPSGGERPPPPGGSPAADPRAAQGSGTQTSALCAQLSGFLPAAQAAPGGRGRTKSAEQIPSRQRHQRDGACDRRSGRPAPGTAGGGGVPGAGGG